MWRICKVSIGLLFSYFFLQNKPKHLYSSYNILLYNKYNYKGDIKYELFYNLL